MRGIENHKGKWRYRFRLRGRQVNVSTGLKATERNLPAAVRQMDEHRERILRGEPEPVPPRSFKEAVESFLAWSKLELRGRPNTWKRQKTSMTSLQAFIGKKTIDKIKPGELEGYKTWRRERDIKEITLRHDLHSASQLFQFARKHGWLDHDPLDGVKIPSDQQSRNDYELSDEDEHKYLEACAAHDNLVDLATLMLQQGMRPAEILQLRKHEVDLEAATLRIVEGKSRASRRILHLTGDSMKVLGHRMAGESPWIFPSRRKVWHRKKKEFYWKTVPNKHLTYSGVRHPHEQVLKETGLCFGLYSLRHTFGTRLWRRTKDIYIVAKILGHADLKTVARYVHATPDDERAAMRQFEAAQVNRTEVVQ